LTSSGGAIKRSDVGTAVLLFIITTVDFDVADLTSGGGPRVADEPVAFAVLNTVINEGDSMVDVGLGLVATIEDDDVVGVPRVGIDGDSDGSNHGNSGHQLSVVVFGELNVAANNFDQVNANSLCLVILC